MVSQIRPLVAGNWKMNGTGENLSELRAIAVGLSSDFGQKFDALVCVPATLLTRASDTLNGETLALGGEDCHWEKDGAYTGDISAEMLQEAGASFVIVGHSERRAFHNETDKMVCAKAKAAKRAGLVAIICVGETLEERESGNTLDIIGKQLAASVPDGATAATVVIAYEPIWAIGTGKTPTIEDVAEVHAFMRGVLSERFAHEGNKMRLLYGGSVKASNSAELLAIENVNGALVGGASLKAADFLGVCGGLLQNLS